MTVTASELMTQNPRKSGEDTPDARRRRQRRKNLALAVVLAVFAVLVYFVAIVRMGGGG